MEDAAVEEMDMFEEGGEESFHDEGAFADGFEENLGEDYAKEDIAAWEALEEAMADALEAYDTDEFLGRALGGIARVSGLISPTSATRAKKIGKLLILRSRIFKGRHYKLDFLVRR